MFKMENINENLTLWFMTNQYGISLAVCFSFLAYVIAKEIKKSRNNFPAGPMGFPIVGYLPFLTKHPHVDFMELGMKFGDVFSVRFGSRDIVVVHGGDVIKESINKCELLGRPPNVGNSKLMPLSVGLAHNLSYWKEQRKFQVKSMKHLGLGKTKIEEDIMGEINHFLEALRNQNSEPRDVKEILAPSISNNMCALIFGKRFKYDDPASLFLHKSVEEGVELVHQASMDLAFPWLRYIPFASKILDNSKAKTIIDNLLHFVDKERKEHMETINPENVRDFIDQYLLEIESQGAKDPNSSFNHNTLINSALDLFFGGSETVRTTILWILYIMAAFPDIQKKVQREIFEVIEPEKKIEFKDMIKMPYTHAVLMETMRWKSTFPLSLLRYTLDDVIVGGYHIPKGTVVFFNIWAVHHDPRYWNDPEKMNPERFLSKDGKSVIKTNYFIPFSLGRRGCPGESMAYMEMFLYCTSILQEFNIAFPDGTEPTFDATFAIIYRLKPYLLRFIPKN